MYHVKDKAWWAGIGTLTHSIIISLGYGLAFTVNQKWEDKGISWWQNSNSRTS